MVSSMFDDKLREPDDNTLAEVLGSAARFWTELRHLMAAQYAPLAEEWVFGGKKYGWSLRLKQRKRAILYMTPLEGHFRVAFAFGEKAVEAAQQSNLPVPVLELINGAPKYPEGKGVRMEVKGDEDVRIAVKLAGIKMAN